MLIKTKCFVWYTVTEFSNILNSVCIVILNNVLKVFDTIFHWFNDVTIGKYKNRTKVLREIAKLEILLILD